MLWVFFHVWHWNKVDMSVLIAIMLCRKELASPLWARARQAGAFTDTERRNFGIADDIYAAGLLLAYMAFIPFCKPGSIDGPSLQRCAAVAAVSTANDACLTAFYHATSSLLPVKAWQQEEI